MDNFLPKIYQWYSKNKRKLPWRETNDPYKIWLSEIILQQTRVAQGITYYYKFINVFPTVYDLASASEDEVLKLWQGLGYYSRARNLHATSKTIVRNFNGKFPETYHEIIDLKGIGPYTAAAIASIAFNLPFPVIDGNIYRIFSRYFGVITPIDLGKGKKEIQQIATEIMPELNAGFHNQALMDFGALQCIPKSPDCNQCPVHESCYAIQNNVVDQIPVKSKRTKQRVRYFYYYLVESSKELLIEKRKQKDIWQNLYQFPLLESDHELMDNVFLYDLSPFKTNNNLIIKQITKEKKHVLSHQIIYARLIHFQTKNLNQLSDQYIRVNKKDIYNFAVPRLLENFLNEINFGEI